MSTLLGTTLNDRYRLDARIGAGGMSTVYRALDETLQREVAIKLMNREVAADSAQLERFRREARAVAQLSHPHVVGVIDAGEDDGRPYIVFEYIEGETLKERIKRLGRLPITEAVAYAIEIARALGAAHARNIVHRDVKPQNVLIDDEGSAKVTDFGIARTLDEDGLTADGRVLGTTDYVAPEQALGQPVTGQSDLYSLGIALYEMLTGEVPFKGDNQVAVAMMHVRDEIPDVRSKRPEVSAALASIIDKATAKRVKDRYADDQSMIGDLEEALALETARAGSATGEVTSVLKTLPARYRHRVPYRIRHRTRTEVYMALAAVLVIAVGLFVLLSAHRGAPPANQTAPHGTQPVTPRGATAYNPDGINGDTAQNNSAAGLAIDGQPSTAWTTENYYSGSLAPKPGVGIYVNTAPGTTASKLVLDTSTPGYQVVIYGSNTTPNPVSFMASNWIPVSAQHTVKSGGVIPLTGGDKKYSSFLVWITQLPPNRNYAAVNEILLYR
jgi:eukaryotic-like serine/threonine-protein kinase